MEKKKTQGKAAFLKGAAWIAAGGFVAKLIGQINYVLSVEPDNEEMQRYRNILMKNRQQQGGQA